MGVYVWVIHVYILATVQWLKGHEMTVILVSINQINIKTLSKHVIEGLTMVVDDGGMIPDIG